MRFTDAFSVRLERFQQSCLTNLRPRIHLKIKMTARSIIKDNDQRLRPTVMRIGPHGIAVNRETVWLVMKQMLYRIGDIEEYVTYSVGGENDSEVVVGRPD